MGYLITGKVNYRQNEPLKISVSVDLLRDTLAELTDTHPNYPNVIICLKAFPEVAWVDIDTDFDIKDK